MVIYYIIKIYKKLLNDFFFKSLTHQVKCDNKKVKKKIYKFIKRFESLNNKIFYKIYKKIIKKIQKII